MTVSNTVAGVEDSENLSYTFTIQKDNTPVSGAFCTIFDGGKNDAKSETTSSEGTFTLKDGEYAVISGLEDGTYTVTETGVSDSTDTNSYTLDDNFTTYVTTSTGTSGAGAQTTTARSATVDVAQADTETPKVHFLNDFKSTADTGTGTATSVSLENAISVQPHTVKAADGTETEAADGTYDLTFTVKGKKGITTDRINADIVFVTDGSDDQQEAADALVQYFKDRTELVNSRFAVVNTKTGQAVKQSEDAYWTDSGSIIYSDGSTGTAEYQTAITAASQLLADDAENVKVLICLDDSGTIDKPAGIDHIYTGTDIQPSAIFEEVRTVDCKNVMVENILSRYAEWSTGENLSLTLTVMDDNGKDISTTSASTSGKDSSTASGTPIAIASVVIGEKTITASYVVSNGQQKIVLEIPGHLSENYTYAVTARIEPTEAAYKYYMEHGSYARNADGTLIVGGTGTGLTSANANGFYVNQQAAVTYSVGGVEKTAAYENPVIQLQTVYRWNIFKVSANNYDYGLAGAAFTLVPTDGSGTTYYATSGDGTSGEAGKLTWYTDDHYQKAANYIAPGTYTLTETAAPAGYLVSNVEWTIIVGKDNDIQIKKDGETINPDAASAAKQVITKTKTESEGSPAVVTYAIKFENEILYSLPSAGGEGIFRYLIAGMLLMMCGALLIFAKRRKILRI
jgi:hypothetical protein